MDALCCFHWTVPNRAALGQGPAEQVLSLFPRPSTRFATKNSNRSLLFSSTTMVVVKAFGVQDLYHSAELETAGIMYHPFTRARLTGTLPRANLSSFLCDEAVLLSAAAMLAKSQEYQPVEEMLAARIEGVRPSSKAEVMRKFMLDGSAQGDGRAVAILMAFLHVRIALERQLGSFMPQGDHWLACYELPEFQARVSGVEQDLARHLSQGSKANDLQMVFKETLRHQLQVLGAACSGLELEEDKQSPWHPANILFTTDYDVTCTVRDTSEVLVAAAQRNRNCIHLEADYWSLMKLHDTRIKACLSLWEHDNVSAKLTAQEDKRSSPFSKLDVELRPLLGELLHDLEDVSAGDSKYKNMDLRGVLKQLGELERRVNKEVMAAGVLRGVRREQIRQQVKDIPLHNRCAEVLLQLSHTNTPVHYISATWSRDLVLGGVPELPKGMLFIHSNDLQYDENGVSDGTFEAVVQDAFDKEAILQALEAVYAGRRKGMTVFLGDSTNDLLALLNADLGIVVGQNPAFREMLSRYKLQVLPLAVASARIAASAGGQATTFRHSGILFETSGWAEVEACLLFANRNRVLRSKLE